jgi:monofunctional biosynthetic peptidoglycan transglycosylase
VGRLKKENPGTTALMDYREREWRRLGTKVRIEKKWVPLSRVSPYLIKAVIIAEDDKFWSHHGFDLDAIQKALEKDIQKGSFAFGGSTISQQLAKNLYLTPSKNPVRKLREAVITWRMERTLTKRRILEIYLNVAEWGNGVFGIEAASFHHYGKPSSLLSAEEAARLAAVLPNPRKYTVNSDSRYVQKRARIIYDIMVRRGIVIPEYDEAVKPAAEEGSGKTEDP